MLLGVDAAATANDRVLLVGDFSKFVIAQRIGKTVELVPHLFTTANNRPSGQRGYFIFGRIDDGAFAVLNVATAA